MRRRDNYETFTLSCGLSLLCITIFLDSTSAPIDTIVLSSPRDTQSQSDTLHYSLDFVSNPTFGASFLFFFCCPLLTSLCVLMILC